MSHETLIRNPNYLGEEGFETTLLKWVSKSKIFILKNGKW